MSASTDADEARGEGASKETAPASKETAPASKETAPASKETAPASKETPPASEAATSSAPPTRPSGFWSAPPEPVATTTKPAPAMKKRTPASAVKTRDALLVAACLLGMIYLGLQIATFGYGRDQGIYAMVARQLVRGEMPYRDAWDFKPPGIFLIYAFTRVLFGSRQMGIRLVEVAGLFAQTWAMTKLSLRWWGDRRIGVVAGALAMVLHAELDFWHTAQPESFGGMVTIFALLALGAYGFKRDMLRPLDRELVRRWVLSGALFGFAGLLKPPLAGGGAIVALYLASVERERGGVRAAAKPILAVLAGGAIPFVLCLFWFAAKGAIGDLYQVLFVFTPHYTALSWVGETIHGMLYWGFLEWLSTYSSVATAGLALLAFFQPTREQRPGVLVVFAIIGLHLAGVAMQGKFFPYHYGATWPLTAFVVAVGAVRMFDSVERFGVAGFAAFAALWGVIIAVRTSTKDTEDAFSVRSQRRTAVLLGGMKDTLELDKLASVADVNAIANREVAERLKVMTPPDRPIFVWGFEPVIYDLADRSPASRYLYDVPQRVAWAKARERKIMMADLEAHRPSAIVVERHDVFPMVTGTVIDSADTVREFPELERFLEGYERDLTIEDFEIYKDVPR